MVLFSISGKMNFKCRCGNTNLNFKDVSKGYFCACDECDGDMYKFEVEDGN